MTATIEVYPIDGHKPLTISFSTFYNSIKVQVEDETTQLDMSDFVQACKVILAYNERDKDDTEGN